jgi:hypothetical protein
MSKQTRRDEIRETVEHYVLDKFRDGLTILQSGLLESELFNTDMIDDILSVLSDVETHVGRIENIIHDDEGYYKNGNRRN